MLGHDLVRVFEESRHEVLKPAHSHLDIADSQSAQKYIAEHRPEWVVLSAAYTRVDDCESNRDLAMKVNAEGAANVARACKEAEAKMVYVSTDYVFQGDVNAPCREDDPTDPINVYGASKLAGENYVREIVPHHLIIRTAWLYGLNGNNFVEAILKKAGEVSELKVVNDQQGSPTNTRDLAEGIARLIGKNAQGVVNVTNTESCTWFEFAKNILSLKQIEGVEVLPVSTAEFNAPAKRPAYSILSPEKYVGITGQPLRPWKDALKFYMTARKN